MTSLLLNHWHQQYLLLGKHSSRHLLEHRTPVHRIRRTFVSTSSHPSSLRDSPPRRHSPSLKQHFDANYPRSCIALETKRAGLSSWTAAAIIIGLAGGVLLALSSPTPVREPQQDQKVASTTNNSSTASEENWESKMTGEVQPGRPGTLTPEQEEKLRQFWIAASRVYGIIDDKFIEELKTNGTTTTTTSESKDKSQKKRLGIFSRKHKKNDSDAESTTSADTERTRAPSITQDDDKYGQTKQFHDTISRQSPESLRQTCWSMVKHDHPDALLLRFLRARRWDVEKALIMMISTMNWRATEAHVDDDVMFNGEEGALKVAEMKDEEAIKRGSGEEFIAQLRMGKSFFHGVDLLDRPICYVRARLHKAGEHSQVSMERATFYQIETARMMLAPPVDTATVVFDLTGFSLANMDYAPVKFMIKCFEANYPESLGVILVHHAPWVFQGVWKIIRGWLDPVVASKVHFTNDISDLSQFIARSRIPKVFGGDEDWEFRYLEPVPGENWRMQEEGVREGLVREREGVVRRFEEATVEWIEGVEKGVDVSEVKKRRNAIAEELRVGYWKLDPYIRARSYYDRSGVLKEGGIVEFYPGNASTTTTTKTTMTEKTMATKSIEPEVISPTSMASFVTAKSKNTSDTEAGTNELTGGMEKVGITNGNGVETSEADLD